MSEKYCINCTWHKLLETGLHQCLNANTPLEDCTIVSKICKGMWFRLKEDYMDADEIATCTCCGKDFYIDPDEVLGPDVVCPHCLDKGLDNIGDEDVVPSDF